MEVERKRKILRRTLGVAAVVAVIAAIAGTFPRLWGPWLARRVVSSMLPHGKGAENEIEIRRISPWGVKVGAVRLGGIPSCPSVSSAEVKFSPLGLLAKRIDLVRIDGVSVDPEYKVVNFSMPSKGSAGPRHVGRDPLCGWRLDKLVVTAPRIDFRGVIPDNARKYLKDAVVGAEITVERGAAGYAGRIDGAVFGGVLEGRLNYSQDDCLGSVALSFMPGLAGVDLHGDAKLETRFAISAGVGYRVVADGSASLEDSAFGAEFSVDASGGGTQVRATVTRREITERDPLVRAILSLPDVAGAAEDVEFSAKANSLFTLGVTNGVANWTLIGNMRDGEVSFKAGDMPASIGGVAARATLHGLGPHFDIDPMPLSFTNAEFGTFSLGAGRARLVSSLQNLLISEATVGFCGGHLRLYSLNLDYQSLNAGFTVFIDGLEVEDMLKMFPKFKSCSATGKLYGRLPLFIRGGGETLRFGDGFLYTPPGDNGVIRIENTAAVEEMLGSSGMPGEISRNLARALRNIEYDILRFDLRRGTEGEGKLAIRLRGETREGKTVAPVDVNVSVNGALENVLDFAVKTAKMKAK